MTRTQPKIHIATIPVRWSDFDRYGHVMNANYIEIAQEARLQFAQDRFFSQGHEFAVYVRRLESDFFRPIRPDTTAATVRTQVVHIGDTSFTTRQEVRDREDRLNCVVTCVQVAVDLTTERPRSLTSREVGILTQGSDAEDQEAIDGASGAEDLDILDADEGLDIVDADIEPDDDGSGVSGAEA